MATIPQRCKPSKVLSKDQTRPILTNAYIRKAGDRFQIEATDSYRLVILPIETEGDDELAEGYVSADALKAIEKSKTAWTANGRVDVGEQSFARVDQGRYPDCGELVPEPAHESDTFTVGVNAKFLHELADALGSQNGNVVLTFDLRPDGSGERPTSALRAIPVRAQNGHGTGLIMPVRTS